VLESGAAAAGGCEACGGEMQLPPTAPQEKFADVVTPEVGVRTPEVEAQTLLPTPEAIALEERQPGGLPAVRRLEIGLAAVALTLAAVTLRIRRRVR
jgi:hypothetical protein